MMRKRMNLLMVWLLLGLPVSAVEESKPVQKEPATDAEFLLRAIAAESAEQKLAELAVKKARDEKVRKLAQAILTGCVQSRNALTDRARQMKVTLTEDADPRRRELFERLEKLEGKVFDQEYLRQLVEGHEKGVRLYQKWGKDAADAGVRDLASRTLLLWKDHLEQARTLATKFQP